MKALSIQQPWAWAIFNGKPVENRDWSTSYRGPLLIHAGKKFDDEGFDWICDEHERLGLSLDIIPAVKDGAFFCGGLIGIVDMVDCVQEHDDRWNNEAPWRGNPWFSGRYGFVFANPRLIEFVPYRGKLGIFDVPEGVVKI